MGIFSDIGAALGFGGDPNYTNPMGAASPYLEQIPGTLQEAYQPYIDVGLPAFQQLGMQAGMLGTPAGATDILSQVQGSYETSPYYQYLIDQMIQAANQSAAAGGRVGIPAEQYDLSQRVANIAQQGLQDYTGQALGLYGIGLNQLGGLGQIGYGASTGLGSGLASNLLNQANLAYTGQQNVNMANQAAANRGAQSIGSLAGLGGLAFGVPGLGSISYGFPGLSSLASYG